MVEQNGEDLGESDVLVTSSLHGFSVFAVCSFNVFSWLLLFSPCLVIHQGSKLNAEDFAESDVLVVCTLQGVSVLVTMYDICCV